MSGDHEHSEERPESLVTDDGTRPSAGQREPERAGEHGLDGEDLREPSLYINRELSWLDFNERVLQLAEDAEVPLLERVKFCAIYTTNLDEYYMVRVAGLQDQIEAGVENPSPGRPHSVADDRPDPRARARARRAAQRLLPGAAAPGARRSRDPRRRLRGARRRAARPAGAPLPEGRLPRADTAGRRPRATLPVHLQPLAQPGRAGARSGHRPDRLRAREGAHRDPAALRRDRTRQPRGRERRRRRVWLLRADPDDAGSVGGRDRPPPRRALPGHGDRRLRRLPGHARRRPRGLRRRRRPAAGRRGRAAPAPLRRGRARRARHALLGAAAQRAGRAAGDGRGGDLPGAGPAGHGRAVADRATAGHARAARAADERHHPSAAAAPRGGAPRRARGDARRRRARAPPLRLIHDLRRALRRAGRRRPQRARDQADRVPHERRLAARAGPDRRHRARQAGRRAGRAQGALRRAHEHPLGQGAWRRPACTSSTDSRP